MLTVKNVDRVSKRRGDILGIKHDALIIQAAEMMKKGEVGCLLVLDDKGKLAGIITERDIIGKVVALRKDPSRTVVESVMTAQVVSCEMGTHIDEAERLMARYEIRHLPIVEKGVPIGMISSRDLLAYQLISVKAEVQRQSRLLQQLEGEYPGITRLQTNQSGRVVI